MKYETTPIGRLAALAGLAAVLAGIEAPAQNPPVQIRPPATLPQLPGRTLPGRIQPLQAGQTYLVTAPGLTDAEGKLLGQVLKAPGQFAMGDGSVRFLSRGFLALPMKPVSDISKDEGGKPTVAQALQLDALKQMKVMPPQQALARVAEALKAAKLEIPGAVPRAGHSTAEVSLKGQEPTVHNIDTFVTFSFRLGTVPLIGPGAKMRFSFDGGGQPTGIRYAYRQLKPGPTVKLLSSEEADKRLAESLGTSPERLKGLRKTLVYYAPPMELRGVKTIFPHYLYSGAFRAGDETYQVRDMLLPAVQGAPTVGLRATAQGRQVSAGAEVTGGRGPYTYDWSSSNAVLDPKATSKSSISYAPRSGRGAGDSLTLIVTDADGLQATARVSVNATPAEELLASIDDGMPTHGPAVAPDPEPHPFAVGPTDVGAEYCGSSYADIGQPALGLTPGNASGFKSGMAAMGVPSEFFWGEKNAWETDFKAPSLGGDDTNNADHVDMTFFTGHANGNGFLVTSSHSDNNVQYPDAQWGDNDLEWIVIAACGPLQSGTTPSVFTKWGPTFKGLHAILGYATNSADTAAEGSTLAGYMNGFRLFGIQILPPQTVANSWLQTGIDIQGSSVVIGVMVPIRNDGVTNYGDYFWGKGPTGPDIRGSNLSGHMVVRTTC